MEKNHGEKEEKYVDEVRKTLERVCYNSRISIVAAYRVAKFKHGTSNTNSKGRTKPQASGTETRDTARTRMRV